MEPDTSWQKLEFDLASFCEIAAGIFPVDAIYLFGSRRFRTTSLRSDIDIFFHTREPIKPSDIRTFIDKTCRALDIFVLNAGTAMSAANESYIQGADDDDILAQCSAVKLWSRGTGLEKGENIPWKQLYASHVSFEKTMLPNPDVQMSLESLKSRLKKQSLPNEPIIGENETEVALTLVRTAETIAEFRAAEFSGKGDARKSFAANPSSEYDFQDLFWIACKPWVQSMERERVEIYFDGQRKHSDFSINASRFIIEMKFVRDTDDKRTIVKTLDGLSRFYLENGNVQVLVFIIYAKREAEIDRRAWEERYSDLTGTPKVILRIITVEGATRGSSEDGH